MMEKYNLKNQLMLLTLLSVLIACSDSSEEDNPITVIAEFNADNTTIKEGESVIFTDESTGNPNSWNWEFEGGEPTNSTNQNPTVMYSSEGDYAVTLTVSNDDTEDATTKNTFITVEPIQQVVADFNADKIEIIVGESINYTDESTGNPNSWNWDFEGGDPANSTDQNPTVTYQAEGEYAVTLTVSNEDTEDSETKSAFITVNPEQSEFELIEISTPISHQGSDGPCTTWEVVGTPIIFSVCSRASPTNGFYVVENTGDFNVELCWTINFNDQDISPIENCRQNLAAGGFFYGTCSGCGTANEGVSSLEIRSYKALD